MVPLGLLPEKRWRLRMVLGLSKYVLGFPREMPGCHRKTLGLQRGPVPRLVVSCAFCLC